MPSDAEASVTPEADGRLPLFPYRDMLAKKTSKNQITLPKAVVARFGSAEYFDVSTDGTTIILRPLQPSRAEAVRERLAELGVNEDDVSAAVAWAREER